MQTRVNLHALALEAGPASAAECRSVAMSPAIGSKAKRTMQSFGKVPRTSGENSDAVRGNHMFAFLFELASEGENIRLSPSNFSENQAFESIYTHSCA